MPDPRIISGYAKYSFCRAYLSEVAVFYGEPITFTNVDNVLHCHYSVPGFTLDTYVTVRPEVWAWSSNQYTLDHWLESEESFINGSPTPIHFGFGIHLRQKMVTPFNYFLSIEYVGGTAYNSVLLPAATVPYWMPPFP